MGSQAERLNNNSDAVDMKLHVWNWIPGNWGQLCKITWNNNWDRRNLRGAELYPWSETNTMVTLAYIVCPATKCTHGCLGTFTQQIWWLLPLYSSQPTSEVWELTMLVRDTEALPWSMWLHKLVYKKKFTNLFIWLYCVLVVAQGIFCCGLRTLSCSICDFVPWPRIGPLHWGCRV